MGIKRITFIVVVLFVVAGIAVIALDWGEIKRIAVQANWPLLMPAIVFTGFSYACLSYSSVLIFRTFRIDMKFRELLMIGFVANAVTFLLNVGGLTGISLQFALMKRRGLPTEDILAASFFQLYFSGLILIVLLPVGVLNILSNYHQSAGSSLGLGIAATILLLVLITAGVIVFSHAVRTAIFKVAGRVFHFISRRSIDRQLNDFDRTLAHGTELMLKHPRVLLTLFILAIGDWASTVAALWFCFAAMGYGMAVGKLVTGFSLGITAGLISMVPGGLGVQEGSMSAIYALLGVPLGTAVLASILFRVVYYFLPFFVSLGFYRRLLRTNAMP